MAIIIPIYVFVFGLIVGSFLNVCIYRIPRGGSLIHPRSRCPRCERPIVWYDNIPVLSYVMLKGRCRNCRKRISVRYPAVELLSGMLFLALWRRWWLTSFWYLPAFIAASGFIVVAFIDWDTFLIPDVLSYGLLAVGIIASPINPYLGAGPAERLLWSVAGGFGGFLMCWGTAALGELIFKKEAMGGGDVKLMAAIGAWGGILGAFDCLLIASLLGSLYGVGLLLRGKIKKKDPIPFGPFLSAGAIVNLFYLMPIGFPFFSF